MSDCRKCIWRLQCFTQADCEYYDPIIPELDAEVEAAKAEYREAFWEYAREDDDGSDYFFRQSTHFYEAR